MRPAIKLRRAARRRGSGIFIRLPATRCLNSFLHFVITVHADSDGAGMRIGQEVTSQQTVAQLLQAFFTKVTHTQKVILIHREHLTYFSDITALEAVIGTYREIQFLNGRIVYLLRDGEAAQGWLFNFGHLGTIVSE